MWSRREASLSVPKVEVLRLHPLFVIGFMCFSEVCKQVQA